MPWWAPAGRRSAPVGRAVVSAPKSLRWLLRRCGPVAAGGAPPGGAGLCYSECPPAAVLRPGGRRWSPRQGRQVSAFGGAGLPSRDGVPLVPCPSRFRGAGGGAAGSGLSPVVVSATAWGVLV